MKITYRQAAREDLESIYALCAKLIEEYEQPDAVDIPRVLQWVREKLHRSIREYTVILAEGQTAGYFHFYRNEDGVLELDDLYVLPEFQNRGIGTGVIRSCCDWAREPVMLYVFQKNLRAVALYQRLGFEIFRTIRDSRYIMINGKGA